MNITYDNKTDTMYINLSPHKAVDSNEVTEGIVLDFNESGDVVGIDIQHASQITAFDFAVDEKGAVIDLQKYGTAFENFVDGLVANARCKEKKSSLSVVKKRLSKK